MVESIVRESPGRLYFSPPYITTVSWRLNFSFVFRQSSFYFLTNSSQRENTINPFITYALHEYFVLLPRSTTSAVI